MSLENPTITTVIPTYRRPKLLARAIRSVLNQTFDDFQLLILDNASGDETESVVAKFAKKDPRVKYHRHATNVGSFNNFQYGLKAVRTPFFSVLSDDDLILPKFYTTSMNAFENTPEASFVACGVLHITPDGQYCGMPVANLPEGFYRPPEGLVAIIRHGHAEWTGILFRSSILQEIGYLDLEAGYVSDLDFELRAAARTCFIVSHEPGAIFSTQPLTPDTTGVYPFDKVWPAWPHMVQQLIADPNLSDEIKETVRIQLESRFRDSLLMLGIRYLYQNKTADAMSAQHVLRQEYKRYLQAELLAMAIRLHKWMGPERAFMCLEYFRNLLKKLKAVNVFNKKRSFSNGFEVDVMPYLHILELSSDRAEK